MQRSLAEHVNLELKKKSLVQVVRTENQRYWVSASKLIVFYIFIFSQQV